jgi:preprotein translocase subunit YajC
MNMFDITDIFVGTAHAQAAGATAGGGLGSLMPLIIIFGIFYFLLIRPQQKKLKEHQQMVESAKRNDKIVTAGGIVGTIAKVNSDNETVEVKITTGVEVTVMKSTIANVLTKSSSVEEKSEKKPTKKKKKK